MNKRYWHFVWTTYVKPIRVWYLVALTLISAIVCVSALRTNNVTMGRLRDAVYAADKNNDHVVESLQDLQQFVTGHMNTSLTAGSSVYPPIQLKYTYDRLREAATQQANASNSQIYTDAQKFCESENSTDFSGRNRVPCIEKYVTDHGGQPAPTIPDGMYKFNFTSPTWSPDLAGWSLVLTVIFFALLVVRIALGWILKKLTRK